MTTAQKCMHHTCEKIGVALIRDGLLLCARHALRWAKREDLSVAA